MILYQMSLIFHNKALFWETVANLNKKDNMCKQLISTLFDQSTQSEQEKSSSCVLLCTWLPLLGVYVFIKVFLWYLKLNIHQKIAFGR